MKNLLLFTALILSLSGSAQSLEWLKTVGSAGHEGASALCSDRHGNFYMAGVLGGGTGLDSTCYFGNLTVTATSDAFIARFDTSGNFKWVRTAHMTNGMSQCEAIAADHFGNLYAVGRVENITPNSVIHFGNIQLPVPTNPATWQSFLVKYDTAGTALWGMLIPDSEIMGVTTDQQGNVYITGNGMDDTTNVGQIILIDTSVVGFIAAKIDSAGNVLWAKSEVGSGAFGFDIVADQHGNAYVAGTVTGLVQFDTVTVNTPPLDNLTFLLKYDSTGAAVFARTIDFDNYASPTVEVDGAGNIFLAAENGLHPDVRASLAKFNPAGNMLWHKVAEVPFSATYDVAVDSAGNSYICGYSPSYMIFDSFGVGVVDTMNQIAGDFIFKFDAAGNPVWGKVLTGTLATTTNLAIDPTGKVIMTGIYFGNFSLDGSTVSARGWEDVYIARFNAGSALHSISGRVFIDTSGNCQLDPAETLMSGIVIRTTPDNYFAFTDSLGQYTLRSAPGNYTVQPVFMGFATGFVHNNCSPSYAVTLDAQNPAFTNADFGIHVSPCPLLSVSASVTIFRRCRPGTAYIVYRNLGFAPADSVQVHVKFPEEVVFQSSANSYLVNADSTYTFYVGAVQAGQANLIEIKYDVKCDDITTLGLTQCIEASITPVYTCSAPDSQWNRASLTADGVCNRTYTVLKVKNEGVGDMTDSVEYRIFSDTTISVRSKILLQAGDSIQLQVNSYGSTTRIEVDQVQYHPHNTQVSAAIENCKLDPTFTATLGFINDFPLDDDPPQLDIFCGTIVGSYDPNDKQVAPEGIGQIHRVPPGTRFDYQVRFQNTGTDTAFTVVIVDTLASHLDISTFQSGVSSHPYELAVSGHGVPVLTFTFNNILLPDSTTDLPGSNGFVTFEIAPYDTLPLGTVVENFADIYFDFNPPVRTNTVFNTISLEYSEDIDSSEVRVCGGSVAAHAWNDEAVCESDTVLLRAYSAHPGHGMWEAMDGTTLIENPFNTYTTAESLSLGENTFRWTVTLCDSVAYDDVVIDIRSRPEPEIIQVGYSLGSSLQAVHYYWYRDGVPLNIDERAIQVIHAGAYELIIDDGVCLSNPIAPVIFTHTKAEPFADLRIYPNPNNGIFNLAINGQPDATATLSILTAHGSIVRSETISLAGNHTFDLTDLATGVYFLKLEAQGSVRYAKVVLR